MRAARGQSREFPIRARSHPLLFALAEQQRHLCRARDHFCPTAGIINALTPCRGIANRLCALRVVGRVNHLPEHFASVDATFFAAIERRQTPYTGMLNFHIAHSERMFFFSPNCKPRVLSIKPQFTCVFTRNGKIFRTLLRTITRMYQRIELPGDLWYTLRVSNIASCCSKVDLARRCKPDHTSYYALMLLLSRSK